MQTGQNVYKSLCKDSIPPSQQLAAVRRRSFWRVSPSEQQIQMLEDTEPEKNV